MKVQPASILAKRPASELLKRKGKMAFSKGEPVPPQDLDELANKLTPYDKRKFKTALLADEDVPQALKNKTD